MTVCVVQISKYSQIRTESRLFHAHLLSSDIPTMLLKKPNDEVEDTFN